MITDVIKKKLQELGLEPDILPPLDARPVGMGEGVPDAPVPPMESFEPQIQTQSRFSNLPVLSDTAQIENPPMDFKSKMAGAIPPVEPIDARTRSQQIADKIAEIDNRDYSISKDAQGNVVRGKDRKTKWNVAEKIGNALLGFAEEGAVGAVKGATDRNYFKKFRDRFKRAQLLPEYEQARTDETFQSQIASQEAARKNLERDDEQRRIEFDEKQKIKQIELADKAKRDFTSRVWGKQKYWKSKEANAIDRAELARLGLKPEDIADFDFRDPKVKQIGGVTYQWNAQTQSFDESNLPKDDSKEIVSYDITDADGVKRTFRTTADRAAGLVTSTKNAQMQIEAAAQRQVSQQDFTAKQNDLNRKATLELAEYRAAVDAAKNATDDAQKQAAEKRAEDSKTRLKGLENELNLIEIEARKKK